MSKEKPTYQLKDHQLFGANWNLWKNLRSENSISASKKKLARKITLMIFSLGVFRIIQKVYVKIRIKNDRLKDDAPIFVLGHWRSGTTHLHYLLSQDERFIHLGAFQGFFFNVAFSAKWLFKPLLRYAMPETRPQDNVKVDPDAPTEDEHALVTVTRLSGMHMFFFPNNNKYFDQYNCFDGISPKEMNEWRSTFANLLKQIEVFNGGDKKLLLKNPHSTARIRVLYEMYPNAKFIYIHRNPYDVFKSTLTLYNKAVRSQFLQDFSNEQLEELVIYCYEKMLTQYLAHKKYIPEDQLVEIGYSELVDNPLGELKRIYDRLGLGEFENVKPKLESYLKTLSSYKVNKSTPLQAEITERLNKKWRFAFEEWNYKMN